MDTTIIEYNFKEDFEITSDMKNDFQKYGYAIIRGILDNEEVCILKTAIERDDGVKNNTFARQDGAGFLTASVIWNNVPDDVTGMVVRSEKIAGTAEALLGGEVYPYHIKVSLKEAHTGGSFLWHQDYGYWYENGCAFPDMGTFYIALDDATKENGCLQILPGSHKAGRVDHVAQGEQVAADPKRVAILKRMLPLLHAELRAGDAIFFHSNILHYSAQNTSPHRRWGFLVAYNRAFNSPVKSDGHPSASYCKLEKVPNSEIKAANTSLQGIKFVDYMGIKNSSLNSVQLKMGDGAMS